MESVADDPDADPKLVAKCATYFLDNGRYDEAARLLVKGGDHARGLELIAEHDVVIDEVRFFLFDFLYIFSRMGDFADGHTFV